MSLQLLGFLVFIMELASSLISILIGYYAFKSYKGSSAKGFFYLYLGFIILGIGIFLRAITAAFFVRVLQVIEFIPDSLIGLSNFAGGIFTITQLIAYSLFIVTYVAEVKSLGKQVSHVEGVMAAEIFPISRLFYIPTLELLAITMLGFVSVNSLMNFLTHKNLNSALVFLGFSFMLLSHLFFLFMIFNELFLLYGQITQLTGFVCMLIMLIRVNKTHA